MVFGYSYAWIGLEHTLDGLRLVQVTRQDANNAGSERVLTAPLAVEGAVYVRAHFKPVTMTEPEPGYPAIYQSMLRSTNALVTFSYSLNGVEFTPIGHEFLTQQGRWVGTKIGIFAQAASGTPAHTATTVGHADFHHFSVN